MKTVALACILAAGTAWAVVTLSTAGTETPAYNPVVLDLEDRLASLEGRIARLASDEEGPGLRSLRQPAEAADALARRVAALEKELADFRQAQGVERGTTSRAEPRPGRAGAGATARTEEGTSPVRKTPRESIEEARALARGLRAAPRARSLAHLAKSASQAGLFELEEELLREVVESADRDSEVRHESLYKIGWARRNRGDAAGAREAWLAAYDALPRDHWRRGYARLYAAEQGIKAGDEGAAERELHDLVRDIEARPKIVDPYGTLIKRGRALLATLER